MPSSNPAGWTNGSNPSSAGTTQTKRTSGRGRGLYCPHHRTNDHDGKDCPDYLAYVASRRSGSGQQEEAHAIDTAASAKKKNNNQRQATDEHNHIEVISDDDLPGEGSYMLNRVDTQPPIPPKPADFPYSQVDWEVLHEEQQGPHDDAPQCHIEVALMHGQQPMTYSFATRKLKGLLDSGSSVSICVKGAIPKRSWLQRKMTPVRFATKGGVFVTHSTCLVDIVLPQFTRTHIVWHHFHCDETVGIQRAPAEYDFILGRDFLTQVGLILDFNAQQFLWHDIAVPMPPVPIKKEKTDTKQNFEEIHSQHFTVTNYHKYNLDACIPSHLETKQGDQLLETLYNNRDIMKGGLGLVPGALLNIDLKPGASPFYLRPYPVPQLDRMIHFGILEPALHSPWASPSFAIKKKNGSVRIVTDFRKLNSMIVRHPYPLPKLLDIFARVDGFTHATALDLSMGFYHIPLSPSAQQLCTTVLPWGKYRYKRMPMGLSISPDVFQHRMDQLLGDLKFVICWIDDIFFTGIF